MGGIKVIPNAAEDAKCVVIMGYCHLHVFIAGATSDGFAFLHFSGYVTGHESQQVVAEATDMFYERTGRRRSNSKQYIL